MSIAAGKNIKSYSGNTWISRFPGSAATRDLRSPFRHRAEAFVDALRAAGAKVVVAATYRPPKRAYLMHWSWKIAKGLADPSKVPAMEGVDIMWDHKGGDGKYSATASTAAAREMVIGFGMQKLGVAPSLNSRHTVGMGIDMRISWTGTLHIPDATGHPIEIRTTPRSGLNVILHRVAETYGVKKYNGNRRDDPHWSDTGA